MNTHSEKSAHKPLEPIYILGISCFYHDAAAALIKDGVLIAAASEERFTRKKHDDQFPVNAIRYCLAEAGISIKNVSYVGFYDKPFIKFERILESFIAAWPHGYRSFIAAIPQWMKLKLFPKRLIKKELGYGGPVLYCTHHESHAASAFFVSPFKRAAIITVDGVGEWATTSWGAGRDNALELKQEIRYPDSLGLLYSTITHFIGFKPNDAEYKVMGLAPYGKPVYLDKLRTLVAVHDDGSFSLDRSVFRNYYDMRGIERRLAKLFGFPKRGASDLLEQKHKDMAASIQALTNEIMVAMARHVREETGEENLCLAGGVALNCVANSHILKEAGFKRIWVQPAAGDAGGALGVAYYLWHHALGKPRNFEMKHAFWGPSYSDVDIERELAAHSMPYEKLPTQELVARAAGLTADQAVIGWFQGRMEWGPRALGNRSIIADARNQENWQRVNLKIKFRESFRPFAPSVIAERSRDYFDFPAESPYMLFVANVVRNDVPAVTHVDKTARLQTVRREQNPLYYDLMAAFEKLTGCPVIIDTSFNVRGEPIVCSPKDAIDTFLKTDMDYLAIGSFLVDKKQCTHLAKKGGAHASDDATKGSGLAVV